MEKIKKKKATKVAIKDFRDSHPKFTDEHIVSIVKEHYPNIFFNNLDVAIEIVKELYRYQLEWTDESFLSTLQKEYNEGLLENFTSEKINSHNAFIKSRDLITKILEDAKKDTVFLSQYEEYKDPYVKRIFEEESKEKGKTLAQIFFSRLNQEALYQANMMSGFILPFHCYMEPNGDVVFTKLGRNLKDYDANGNPIVCEADVEKRFWGNTQKTSSENKGGCLGIIILIAIILFISL